MESLRFQINERRNELRMEKNRYRQEENNYIFLANNEYRNNLARNEYLKNKESNEREKIKENYEREERRKNEENTIKSNINEFNRFLLDNRLKSELEKKNNQHKNKMAFQKMEDEYNINTQYLNNINDENLKRLDLKEITNNKNAEFKIMELDFEKKNIDNNIEKNIKVIESKNKEELLKKRYGLKSKLNEIQKQKMETKLRTNSNIMKNEKETQIEEYKLNMELDMNKKKIENDKDSILFDIEFIKKAQLLNQALKNKEEENSLNIIGSQIMALHLMRNQMNQNNNNNIF